MNDLALNAADGLAVARARAALAASTPNLRSRDAASQLGISEAAYVASDCGRSAVRLINDWPRLLDAVAELGPVMALTRNAHAVHEKIGVYENITFAGAHALVLGEAIDLRLFPGTWKHAFAVAAESAKGKQRSLQIFDASGEAMHKVHLRAESDVAAFDRLVGGLRASDQSPDLAAAPPPRPRADRPDAEIDVPAFREAWAAMEDTHEFHGLITAHRLGRVQALRLAGADWAEPVAPESLRQALTLAAEAKAPIMVFVGNRGAIQIHTGPVERLMPTSPWFNVMDPGFNLHLREDAIAAAWIVRKPTKDGIVTSLELFDAQGDTIALLFGARKPGLPERRDWRQLVAQLPRRPVGGGA
jgi:putative hemin transport protein